MATMTVARFPAANAALELVTREVPEPGAGQVLLRVRACGICHSDLFVQGGAFPGLRLPRVPGHEVAAVVERVGPGVRPWRTGDRVGIGWHGGHCFVCDSCRVGDFITCREGQITGFAYDGGYGEYMVARAEALARIPDTLGDVEAAPLLCAGITTFNALRNSPARPGDLVAVQGLGGLGHLAVQFAHRMGFRTVAIARGDDKRPLATQLGADEYVDSAKGSAGQALAAMGGARVIVATAPNAAAIEDAMRGLGSFCSSARWRSRSPSRRCRSSRSGSRSGGGPAATRRTRRTRCASRRRPESVPWSRPFPWRGPTRRLRAW